MNKQETHPSGLSIERWNWPFKTPEERKLVAKYFAKVIKHQTHKQVGKARF